MNLVDLRSRCAEIVGLPVAEIPNIDDYLNEIHQYELVNLLGGSIGEGTFDFNTVAAQEQYDLEALALAASQARPLRAVQKPVIDVAYGVELRYTTDPAEFWLWHDTVQETATRPTSILVMGLGKAFLRPVPTGIQAIRIYGQFFRKALDSAGLADTSEAVAVAAGAALKIGIDKGRNATIQRATALYNHASQVVAAKYKARSQGVRTQFNATGTSMLRDF